MLMLSKPAIFSFAECLWFLDRNYDDCLHVIRTDAAVRWVRFGDQKALVEVTETTDALRVKILNGALPDTNLLVAYVNDWFDLRTDIRPFYRKLENQPELAFMTQAYRGLRLVGIPDLFEALCWSIIGQQINLTFAYRLKRALVERYGEHLSHDGMDYYLFPEPSVLAKMSPTELRDIQFSRQKAEYIIGIARAFVDGEISKELLLDLDNEQAIEKKLVRFRGIGPWTANYAMMKCLRCPNALTYGDAGLYAALHRLKGFPKRPSREQLEAFFADFAGWRAYLVLYLWRTLSVSKSTAR